MISDNIEKIFDNFVYQEGDIKTILQHSVNNSELSG